MYKINLMLMYRRTEVEKLREENAKLLEQLEVYEIRKEQMHMQVCLPDDLLIQVAQVR